jgi:hypothetical protein
MDKLIRVRMALAFLRLLGLKDLSVFFQSVARVIAPTPEGVQSTDWTVLVQVPSPLIDGFRTSPGAPALSRPLSRLRLLFVRSFNPPAPYRTTTPSAEDQR